MNPKFTITNAIAAALTRIERARGFLEAATLSDEWVRAMGERAHELATNSRHNLRQISAAASAANVLINVNSSPLTV